MPRQMDIRFHVRLQVQSTFFTIITLPYTKVYFIILDFYCEHAFQCGGKVFSLYP